MTLASITLPKTIESQPRHIQRGQEWLKKATELMKVKQLIKEYEKIESQLMSELKLLSDNTPSRSGNFVLDCIMRKGSVEYTRIPELKGIDLELYRKEPVETWTLTMKIELI